MSDTLIERAAQAVLNSTDWNVDQGENLVETWSLYALACVLARRFEEAEEVLERYIPARWSHDECDVDDHPDDDRHRAQFKLPVWS